MSLSHLGVSSIYLERLVRSSVTFIAFWLDGSNWSLGYCTHLEPTQLPFLCVKLLSKHFSLPFLRLIVWNWSPNIFKALETKPANSRSKTYAICTSTTTLWMQEYLSGNQSIQIQLWSTGYFSFSFWKTARWVGSNGHLKATVSVGLINCSTCCENIIWSVF